MEIDMTTLIKDLKEAILECERLQDELSISYGWDRKVIHAIRTKEEKEEKEEK
jgi:hypothetical protein